MNLGKRAEGMDVTELHDEENLLVQMQDITKMIGITVI